LSLVLRCIRCANAAKSVITRSHSIGLDLFDIASAATNKSETKVATWLILQTTKIDFYVLKECELPPQSHRPIFDCASSWNRASGK
jgi:hypothetical protein